MVDSIESTMDTFDRDIYSANRNKLQMKTYGKKRRRIVSMDEFPPSPGQSDPSLWNVQDSPKAHSPKSVESLVQDLSDKSSIKPKIAQKKKIVERKKKQVVKAATPEPIEEPMNETIEPIEQPQSRTPFLKEDSFDNWFDAKPEVILNQVKPVKQEKPSNSNQSKTRSAALKKKSSSSRSSLDNLIQQHLDTQLQILKSSPKKAAEADEPGSHEPKPMQASPVKKKGRLAMMKAKSPPKNAPTSLFNDPLTTIAEASPIKASHVAKPAETQVTFAPPTTISTGATFNIVTYSRTRSYLATGASDDIMADNYVSLAKRNRDEGLESSDEEDVGRYIIILPLIFLE